MRPVFISYRRIPWVPEVVELARAMRRRGILAISDVSDPDRIAGQAQYDALRRVIQEDCDGFVLHMTTNVPDSACVWNVEIPAALNSFDRGDYDFVPFFRGVAPSDVKDLEPHGRRIYALGGQATALLEGDSAAIAAAHRQLANTVLRARLRRRREQSTEAPLVLGIRTRSAGTYESDADLLLDWTGDFDLILAGEANAQGSALRTAISDVCSALADTGMTSIRISGPAHLSAGLAAGYTFHRATGFRLEVVQGDSLWLAVGERDSGNLRIAANQLDPAQRDILLAVGLSRPELTPDADAAVGELGLRIGGRIAVALEEGAGREAIRSDVHARGIVAELTNALMRARASWGTGGTIHVFMACPFGLAVLLGHALNGFGPLALYERALSRGYVRALDLP